LSSPLRFVCTLCNVEFHAAGTEPPRCPHCLRLTGIVPAGLPVERRERWRPGRSSYLALVGIALAAALATAAWFLLPLLRPADDAHTVETALAAADMPIPWGEVSSLEGIAAPIGSMAPADAADALAAACFRRDGIRLVGEGERPEVFRTGSEAALLQEGLLSRVEAAACILALARAAGTSAAPCAPPLETALVPAWHRPVGICVGDGADRIVVAPGVESPDPAAWQPLPLARFAAIYLAGAAEAASEQARVYALFRQARLLWDDPAFLFRLGVAKARMGVKEFAIEDMRQALAAGAGSDGHLLLADTLLEVGQAAEAVSTYERTGGDDPRVGLGKARALLVLDQADKAGAVLEPLAAAHPELDGVLDTLAAWKLRTGDIDGALAAVEKALALKPRPDHYLMLDDLLGQKGKASESLPRLAAGYDATREVRVGERLIQRQLDLGRKDEAVDFSARLFKDHPVDRQACSLRFDALLSAGRFDEADREADALLKAESTPLVRPAMAAAAIARLHLEAQGGRGIASASDTVKYLALSGPRAVHSVTRWLEEHHAPALAERTLVLALESRPGDEELTNHLYLLYGLHGRAEEARKVREQALAGLEGEARDAREDSLDRIDRYLQSGRGK